MRKQLRALSSLLFISTMALAWMGCSDFRGYSDCNRCYYDAASVRSNSCCEAICPENDTCGPCQQQVIASDITCDGVQVIARQPHMCLMGDQYCMDLCVCACRDVCDVTLSTTLPDGVQFVKSDPEAFQDGQHLVWSVGHLKAGCCENIRIHLRCEREGCLEACFCVSATPVAFCTIVCAKPVLWCNKCGPEEACPGDCLNYCITVGNKGSCTAYDVHVIDNLPDGLEHVSGLNTLTFKLGDIPPCGQKTLNLCLKACKRGKVTNSIIVNACNADQTSCDWTTTVCKYCCSVTKEGPREVRVGQNADYQIVVTNIGDRPLTDLCVVDCAPNGTSIVSANGATISGNRAVWKIDELRQGEDVSLPLTLTTCTPGYYCNTVNVSNCQGACCCAECPCRWRGTPALNVCVKDLEDPICVGDNTSYRISVVNQGSEPDENVRVVVRFPREVVPVSAVGASPGQVSGQTVTFAPYSPLSPRHTLEYRVDARAKERGDARIKVEVMSDSITTPIVQEESTIVN